MGTREKLINGCEYDAFTRWRKYVRWHKRELKWIKRKFWKRIRRKHKQEIYNEPSTAQEEKEQ